jgi:hypothetical protein
MQSIEMNAYGPRPRPGHGEIGSARWLAPLAFLLAFVAVLLVIVYAVASLVMRAMVFPF